MNGTREYGQRIRAARRAAGLTQEQLATRAGITDRTVRSVEAGVTSPQRRIREGLASVLGDVAHSIHAPEADTASTGCGTNNPHHSAEVDVAVRSAVAGAASGG